MGTDSFRRTGANPDARANSSISGFISDAGPYEAIVVGVVEGTRMGQLLVDITDWQGATTELMTGDLHSIPVSYASPFYGTTYNADSQKLPGAPITAAQSYGMWFVPPDVGNKVLVTFVGGDMSRGYWFACIYDSPSHHMVPGIARNIGGKDRVLNPADQLSSYLTSETLTPVTEASTADQKLWSENGATEANRYPHEIQTAAYVIQGLDRDPIRGAISSSSLRESPSNVYGISTPGRKVDSVPSQKTYIRRGGHQFVMDDGDKDGKDQLMRLRTSGGHQILMNDSEHVLYIASDTGQQWLEFSPNGSINVYGAGGINMRSMGPINMHSDSAINMDAMSIKINAGMSVSISSIGSFSASAMASASVKSNGILSLSGMGMASLTAGGSLSMSAVGVCSVAGSMLKLNTPPGGKPPFPAIPTVGKPHIEPTFNGSYWQKAGKVTTSICTVVPSHEPWERPSKP